MELGGVYLKMTPQTFGYHLVFRKKKSLQVWDEYPKSIYIYI